LDGEIVILQGMKKSITLIFLLLPFLTLAQFNKGQVYLGGTFSLGVSRQNYASSPTQNTTQTQSNSFSLSPVAGYFLYPKIAVGGNVGYSYSYGITDYIANGFQHIKTHSFTSGLFARYYIPVSRSFYFAVQSKIYYNKNNSTNTTQNNGTQTVSTNSNYYSGGLNIIPVFIFFPSAKWSIETSIGSLWYDYSSDILNDFRSNNFSLSAGSLSFGLAYYLVRKK
jgi:hypothetical protein